MKFEKYIFQAISISVALSFTSCFLLKEGSTKSIYKSSNSKKNYLTVNTYTHSHCGCTDIYAQKFDNRKLTYEFYYGCTPFFSPQKIVYTYDNDNSLIATNKFKLVDSTSYESKFDSLDLFVLQKIDSFRTKYNPNLSEYKLCKKDYKGLTKTQ